MEPPIQYSRTADNVNIAFWEMGEGKPLIAMPSMPWSHLQMEWTIPELRDWYEDLGRDRTLVRYDGRGFGLSQRQVDDMSLEAEVLDLEAVVEGGGFDLYGTAVIAASRIGAQAGGGEIEVADVVRQLVAGKGFQFTDRGPVVLRGFDEPVRLYQVDWLEGAAEDRE